MRVLLDHDVPHGLRSQFSDEHEVITAQYQGWASYDDDQLLSAAEKEFDILVTLDTNLAHQQNVRSREIGVVVIDVHPVLPGHLERHMSNVSSAISIAAEKQKTLIVREGGIDVPPP